MQNRGGPSHVSVSQGGNLDCARQDCRGVLHLANQRRGRARTSAPLNAWRRPRSGNLALNRKGGSMYISIGAAILILILLIIFVF